MSRNESIVAAIGATLVIAISGFLAKDCYSGEWHNIGAVVVARNFVPDRSHTEVRVSTDSKGNTELETVWVYVPAEYHVMVLRNDGLGSCDVDDQWAYARTEGGSHLTLTCRIGGITGVEYLMHINHDMPIVSPKDL